MRLLFVSAYYPPPPRGGYEELCREVAEALVDRGHELAVLTSGANTGRGSDPSSGVRVDRRLHLEVESGLVGTAIRLVRDRRRLEAENLATVSEIVASFQPEAAMIWGMWNVPRSVPAWIETVLGPKVAYYLCDYWPTLPSAYVQQWLSPARRGVARVPKRLIGKSIAAQLAKHPVDRLRLEHPICVSEAVRRLLVSAGAPVQHARVIYGNANSEPFVRAAAERHVRPHGRLRLLFAGRLSPEKGVAVAIQALALLADRQGVRLDIVGRGDPAYEAELVSLIRRLELDDRVALRGSVQRSDMPVAMAEYDALVFPSEWEEPFARIVLEAMAAGLLVIGTRTGGTGEVLVDGETGLTFARGDARALAHQIGAVVDDPAGATRLAEAGQQRVVQHFSFQRTLDDLEEHLHAISRPRESLVGQTT